MESRFNEWTTLENEYARRETMDPMMVEEKKIPRIPGVEFTSNEQPLSLFLRLHPSRFTVSLIPLTTGQQRYFVYKFWSPLPWNHSQLLLAWLRCGFAILALEDRWSSLLAGFAICGEVRCEMSYWRRLVNWLEETCPKGILFLYARQLISYRERKILVQIGLATRQASKQKTVWKCLCIAVKRKELGDRDGVVLSLRAPSQGSSSMLIELFLKIIATLSFSPSQRESRKQKRGQLPTASLPAFNETLFSGQVSAKLRCQTSFRR